MSDSKSKMPDVNEISDMAKKLFNDVRSSVCEIIDDYKKKREEPEVKNTPPEPPHSRKENDKE